MSTALIVTPEPAAEWVGHRIYLIRNKKVMLSTHLATLYEVEPRVLVQAVKRNLERFPADFMFQLTAKEWRNLKSQIVISSSEAKGHGGLRRAMPYCFTEQGIAMLSSVLKSPLAIQVNISIMRTFIRVRGEEFTQFEMANRLTALEQSYDRHHAEIQAIFDSIREMIALPNKKTRQIGF